ncbi:DsrE family protein [Subtercola vilae]|uniref:Uncharacterized protein n=1 Tax=Subtercola vilae TaxID=2056433 RepID=A0A4T2C1H9_9MICO|nr:DsrE family protein [Subtercola vilae]TIH36156.1 hypothetical protein D4765_10260 [Subtercola vilae]
MVARHLLIHVHGNNFDAVTAALRVARNSSTELGADVSIHIVAQGPLVRQLAKGSPIAPDLAETIHSGQIEVLACRNSMTSAELRPNDLQPGVTTTPSAVAFLAEQQFNGWAYVRL